MPCDSNHLIDVEYDEIFTNIKHTCTYVMFGGDLNTDLSRYASMHTRSLLRFCTEEQGRKSMFKHGGDNIWVKYTSRLLGGFGGMPHRENFFKWCNLVRFGV